MKVFYNRGITEDRNAHITFINKTEIFDIAMSKSDDLFPIANLTREKLCALRNFIDKSLKELA